ncbi:SpoIIE family protein phosphatase [bacterium]|jgi:serine phosphatase RsbU (regulator of sigma subunit)|nr:SpoIIE family protein phosphatase [bacterium]
MSNIENLLILYAGLVLLNTAISAIIWRQQKTTLSKQLFIIWTATFTVLFAQGLLTQNHFVIAIGFSFTFFINTAITNFISTYTKTSLPSKLFYALFSISLVMGGISFYSGYSFLTITLPITLAVSFPLFFTAYIVSKSKWNKLNFTGKALIITIIFFAIHNIDYAFLRTIESATALGFTVATLLVFALSIFAPAIVLEAVTEEKSRISAEVDVAQHIQMEILPKKPEIPGLDLECYMKAADEVGGDYYDVYSFESNAWILLGDVAGHGLGSGLVMFMAQSILSSILHTKVDITPKELNYIANNILYENLERLNEKRPMTLASLRFENEREFTISGSHDNIFIYRDKTKTVDTIEVDQFPFGIGFMNDIELSMIEENTHTLNKNDILFLATDGITEAPKLGSTKGELFGEPLLIEFIKTHADKPTSEIKSQLINILDEYTNSIYHDDVTFIIARST